ncbi:BPL-N domain-containing protein [Kutzneria albida]|uniref:BPL-N domain-containing protein n=1 Tax=Kutzneria albida TaxID=43357 RepID=UPI00046CFB52|nr:BPL-N domain-containing protein [Kutzneria albida]
MADCRGCRGAGRSRRDFLIAAGGVGLLAGLAACGGQPPAPPAVRPVALVYRGPASCSGCSESVATLLENCPTPFRAVYCGPKEDVRLSAASLATAKVYAQPGGGSVESAWHRMREHAEDIRGWVRAGGHYLGFCLGAYLAAATPGFGLLPGNTSQYISTRHASVRDTDDAVVSVTWRGARRHMFFQDGPVFKLDAGAAATVLATYDNGEPAAVVAGCGAGRIGLVGPHPEADKSWYTSGLANPDGIRPDLGYDLIQTTLAP